MLHLQRLTKEAAEYVGVPAQQIVNWRTAGILVPVEGISPMSYFRSDLLEFKSQRKAKVNGLKRDLKALLKRYNASISFECSDSSDTYGIYDAKMVVEMDGIDVLSSNGWSMLSEDIKG